MFSLARTLAGAISLLFLLLLPPFVEGRTPLLAQGTARVPAQLTASPDPLPVVVVPEGRLLRVETEGGHTWLARVVNPGPTWRLGLAQGGVAEVPAEAIRRVVPVRGTVRGERFWPGGLESSGLLGPALREPRQPPEPGRSGLHPRPRVTLGTSVDLGPGRSVEASAVLDPGLPGGSVHLDGEARVLEVDAWSVLASTRVGASEGEAGPWAMTLGHLRWAPDEATQLHLSVGMPSVVEAGLVHRPLRRWAALAQGSVVPGGTVGAATGIRYVGDAFSVEVGIAATSVRESLPAPHPGAPGYRVVPVVRVLHRM